jgi:hypothetical protein
MRVLAVAFAMTVADTAALEEWLISVAFPASTG